MLIVLRGYTMLYSNGQLFHRDEADGVGSTRRRYQATQDQGTTGTRDQPADRLPAPSAGLLPFHRFRRGYGRCLISS